MCFGLPRRAICVTAKMVVESDPDPEPPQDADWPIENDDDTFIFACSMCYYPVVRFEDVTRAYRTIVIVTTANKLFAEKMDEDVQVGSPWQRRVCCYNCGIIFTFNDENVPSIVSNDQTNNDDDRYLHTLNLEYGST